MKRLLTIDPGTKNCYASFFSGGKWVRSYHIQSADFKVSPDLTTVHPFIEELQDIIQECKPTAIVIERFVARQFGTNIAESIGIMLGLTMSMHSSVYAIMASSWKNSFNRTWPDGYKKACALAKRLGVPQHVLDTIATARYALSNWKYRIEDKVWIIAQLKRAAKEYAS